MVARTTQNATTGSAASLLGSGLAHIRWAKKKTPEERTAATQAMRDAFWQKLLDQCDGDEVAAENLRQAHYKAMAAKSLETRRRNAAARQAGA
jgi:hypothetical protein